MSNRDNSGAKEARTTHAVLSPWFWKFVAFHALWVVPAIIAVYPYGAQAPPVESVGAALDYQLGVYGWLWNRPLRLALLVPALLFTLRTIGRVGRL